MGKKIIWLIGASIIILLAIYSKFYYPGSQNQIQALFRGVDVMPVNHFYNSAESSCGIWYENESNDLYREAKNNEKVKQCFIKAFETCDSKNILLVKSNNNRSMLYSFIKMIKKNDQDECIIQNYYEEHYYDPDVEQPLLYINTCTKLSSYLYNSCEPLYIKEFKLNFNPFEYESDHDSTIN